MDKEKKEYIWRRYKYRIIATIAAIAFALITIIFGFGEAILASIIVAVGYIVGSYLDGEIDQTNFRR